MGSNSRSLACRRLAIESQVSCSTCVSHPCDAPKCDVSSRVAAASMHEVFVKSSSRVDLSRVKVLEAAPAAPAIKLLALARIRDNINLSASSSSKSVRQTSVRCSSIIFRRRQRKTLPVKITGNVLQGRAPGALERVEVPSVCTPVRCILGCRNENFACELKTLPVPLHKSSH